jgi:hypothetical protein
MRARPVMITVYAASHLITAAEELRNANRIRNRCQTRSQVVP